MASFLVTGATGLNGNQGGRVARALLSAGQKVHALVRSPGSEQSKALEALGVILHQGDFEDADSLLKACEGRQGVFLNVNPLGDMSKELRQAQNLVSAAKTAGVEHVIYSSVLLTGKYETLDIAPDSFLKAYFRSKHSVEETVRQGGFKHWTIIRPGTFMTNYLVPGVNFMNPELPTEGLIVTALAPERTAAITDPSDIGKFAAAAFLDPGKFHGKEIDVGFAPVTMTDVANALTKVSGKKVVVQHLNEAEAQAKAATNPMFGMQIASNRVGNQEMDFAKAREWGIPLTSFEEFLQQNKETLLRSIGPQVE